jgi:hypothetical protein
MTATTSTADPPITVLGRRVVSARRSAGGYTAGWRGIVTLDDGGSAFVKSAAGADGGRVKREAGVLAWLEQHGHAGIGPRLLGFDDGDPAVLATEDLSDAHWPPPYPADTSTLFDTVDELRRVDAPAELEALEDWDDGSTLRWQRVADGPADFLRLGVCSAEWLERHAVALIEAERRVDLRGRALVHNDVYSGNVCFVEDRALLTDWATAARGNPDLDVAFAIVSVLAEGGHLPERRLLDDEAAWAARLAGHNAVEASAPLPEWADPASTLRQDQLVDLRAALPWAARAIGLDPSLGRDVG